MSDESRIGISYSWENERLHSEAPKSLKEQRAVSQLFNEKTKETSAQERSKIQENEKGSEMVKRSQPVPSLTPRNDYGIGRSSFNQNWAREQTRAKTQKRER